MSKVFYPNQDINDLIESEEEAFFKGGPGSGVRGHTSHRPYLVNVQTSTVSQDQDEAKQRVKAKEDRAKEVSKLTPDEKAKRIKENDAKLATLRKPNPGT